MELRPLGPYSPFRPYPVPFVKNWLSITSLLVLTLVLVSCTDDPVSPSPTSLLSALPLDSGNYWVHDFLHYQAGALVDSSTDSMIIGPRLDWGGESWREIRESLHGWSSHNYYRTADDGVWWLYVLHGDTTPGLFFKYPTSPGEMWINGRGDTMLTRAADETVEVPNGAFEGCIHYQYKGNAEDEGMWLKPGVGWILSHWYRPNDTEHWFRMREYRIESL